MSDCIGQLPPHDPLYGFLVDKALRLGRATPVVDVYPLDKFHTVFRYSLRESDTAVAGKFYGRKWIHETQHGYRELRAEMMHHEFENLRRVQQLGLSRHRHRAVRPLAVNESLDYLLLEEFARGTSLHARIRATAQGGSGDDLCHCLERVACFLAELHDLSQTQRPTDRQPVIAYLRNLVSYLAGHGIVLAPTRARLEVLCDRWNRSQLLATTPQVLTHGDATPEHFFLDDEGNLAVIDWERLRSGDRAADVGYLAAELKDMLFRYTGNPWASEPYIQQLYARYFEQAVGRTGDFSDLTMRGRFYMGCCLLRICRNVWLDFDYRQQLLPEAEACLNI